MISVDNASKIIRSNINISGLEKVDILSCLNRILAQDIKSKDNIPPFDNSAMDGFALKSKSTKGVSRNSPKILRVIEDLPAGKTTKKRIKDNEAARIMTGSAMPQGADCVVKVEETEAVKAGYVRRSLPSVKIFRKIPKGENVRYAGEDVRKGDGVLTKGTIIGPAEAGMIASLGINKIKVYKKARVGILSTGDELVDIGNRLTKGKIRNSNSYSLNAAILDCGAQAVNLGIASDKKSELKKKIKKGIDSKLNILLISGGVSVGDYDFVLDVLKDLGAKIKFWRVRMRPGKPLLFAMLDKVLVFGLPGNPVSSLICFEEFVKPSIMQASGVKNFKHREVYAVSKDAIDKKKDLRYFLRVKTESKNGKLFASLTGPQGSGILKSLVLADGIMVIPEGVQKVKRGDLVKVQLLRPFL